MVARRLTKRPRPTRAFYVFSKTESQTKTRVGQNTTDWLFGAKRVRLHESPPPRVDVVGTNRQETCVESKTTCLFVRRDIGPVATRRENLRREFVVYVTCDGGERQCRKNGANCYRYDFRTTACFDGRVCNDIHRYRNCNDLHRIRITHVIGTY